MQYTLSLQDDASIAIAPRLMLHASAAGRYGDHCCLRKMGRVYAVLYVQRAGSSSAVADNESLGQDQLPFAMDLVVLFVCKTYVLLPMVPLA